MLHPPVRKSFYRHRNCWINKGDVYKRQDLDDAEDIDDFEFEGPEEPTVNEDEEATGEDAGQEELSEEEEAEQRRLYEEDNEDIPIEGDDDLVF